MNVDVIRHLCGLRHSPIRNYIVPGLTSWLIMDDGGAGKLRMFECSREQHEFITPHSHRFDFSACVLRGSVENTLWVPVEAGGDEYVVTTTMYLGEPGKYESGKQVVNRFVADSITYNEGEWYDMRHNEIHSIKFSRDALVLFIEGHEVSQCTQVLEPFVDKQHIQTMGVEDWMFQKGES